MDKQIFDKILTAQEDFSKKPEYQALLKEYEILHARFMQQMETMTPEQQSAVWDYCGMLIEMHIHTLKIIVS